jgi:hypothetical protein
MPVTSAFFAAVRPLFGGALSQSQVDGINVIIAAWDAYGDADRAKLAYILATAFHETAQTMQPVKETQYTANVPSDSLVKARLTKAWKAGKLKVKRDYWSGGYFGRGLVQLTHAANYQKAGEKLGVDLISKPSLALQPDISARILITGMLEGWFTGKKLSDYGADFKAARAVVNGNDRASLIADHAETFLKALRAGLAAPAPEVPPVTETPTGLAAALAWLIQIIIDFIKGLKK